MNKNFKALKELQKINAEKDIIKYLSAKKHLTSIEKRLQEYLLKLKDSSDDKHYFKSRISNWIEHEIKKVGYNNPFKFKYNGEHSKFSEEVLNDINNNKYHLLQNKNGKILPFTKKIIVLDFEDKE